MDDVMENRQSHLKMKNREAANRLRTGSPKFQEVLRQRCRDRMKEKRQKLFDRRRLDVVNGSDTSEMLQDSLTEIVRQEFSDLSTMVVDENAEAFGIFNEPLTEEEIFQLEAEILAEEEEWIMHEFDAFFANENHMLNSFVEESLRDIVICPMCEKSGLEELPQGFICPTCSLCLPPKMQLSQLSIVIRDQVEGHSAVCPNRPSFITLPENNSLSLYLCCETCHCFSLIL